MSANSEQAFQAEQAALAQVANVTSGIAANYGNVVANATPGGIDATATSANTKTVVIVMIAIVVLALIAMEKK